MANLEEVAYIEISQPPPQKLIRRARGLAITVSQVKELCLTDEQQ